jgi:TolB-like protein/Flp pilus assembly protein TadD
MSGDREQEYFCDGMAEEIINALTKLEGLRVVARTSAFQFKGQAQDLRRVGEALNVRSVLEGSVRTAGTRLRVTAQLINVEDGFHLWSERYDRPMDDVFGIQDEIAGSIVESLQSKLVVRSTSLPARRETRPTENRQAYDLYLRALYYEGLITEQGLQKAIDYHQRALALEPEYAAARAGLSQAYIELNTYGFLSAEQALPKAEAAAIQALELDDSLAAAHSALGCVRAWLHWDWAGAESEFRWATELDPGSARTRYDYAGRCLSTSGRTREAVNEARRAHDLDPLSALMNRGLGEILYWDRQYGEAIRQFRHTVELAPDFHLARNMLSLAYSSNGQLEAAFRERLEIFRSAGRNNEVRELEAAWASAGEPGTLRWLIDRGLSKAKKTRTDGSAGNRAWHLALLYARLGETEEALSWLEKAVRQRGGLMVFAKVHPWLDCLHPEPRFGDLLERMGLT